MSSDGVKTQHVWRSLFLEFLHTAKMNGEFIIYPLMYMHVSYLNMAWTTMQVLAPSQQRISLVEVFSWNTKEICWTLVQRRSRSPHTGMKMEVSCITLKTRVSHTGKYGVFHFKIKKRTINNLYWEDSLHYSIVTSNTNLFKRWKQALGSFILVNREAFIFGEENLILSQNVDYEKNIQFNSCPKRES